MLLFSGYMDGIWTTADQLLANIWMRYRLCEEEHVEQIRSGKEFSCIQVELVKWFVDLSLTSSIKYE